MVWFRRGHCPEKIPAPIEYRKAHFTKSGAYYISYCNAAENKRSAKKWLVSVVGAPEEKAVEILGIINKMYKDKLQVKLRWWSEAPPSYSKSDDGSNGEWVGYDPKRDSFDISQESSEAEITLLYYSDGCDPFALLKSIPKGDFMIYYTGRMLVPVCDYIFDKESCQTVACSEYCPLHEIESRGSSYYAPVPVISLGDFSEALLQMGGRMYTLGEMNASFGDFDKKRRALKLKSV